MTHRLETVTAISKGQRERAYILFIRPRKPGVALDQPHRRQAAAPLILRPKTSSAHGNKDQDIRSLPAQTSLSLAASTPAVCLQKTRNQMNIAAQHAGHLQPLSCCIP